MVNIETANYLVSISVQPIEGGEILMGHAVKKIPEDKIWKIASQVSQELTTHLNTMLQYQPGQLVDAMNKGLTVLGLDQEQELLAFGQIGEYPQDWTKQEVYEFRSWLCFKKGGYGKKIAKLAQELAAWTFPDAKLIAIIETNNIRAQQVIESIGGSKFAYKYSDVIRDVQGQPAFMKLYNITKPKEGPNAPIVSTFQIRT